MSAVGSFFLNISIILNICHGTQIITPWHRKSRKKLGKNFCHYFMLRAFPQGRRPLFVFMRLSNFFNLGQYLITSPLKKKVIFSDSFSTYASEKRKALSKNPLYGHTSSVSHATDVRENFRPASAFREKNQRLECQGW